MKKLYDMVVITGTYTNSNGEEKKRYLTIGAMFDKGDGKMSCHLDCIPASNWDGWVGLYEPKPFEQKSTASKQAPIIDDDIAF